jgi:exonuclease SbcD
VYDKGVPPTEALDVLEEFILAFAREGVSVLITAGNHDSAERLAFGSRFMEASGVYIARAFSEKPQVVTLQDSFGDIDFHLMPFVRPVYVRAAFPDAEIVTYEDAMRVALEASPVREGVRSVLVAHQFVTNAGVAPRVIGGATIVGGVNNVDASLFDAYDYVALWHVHVPQQVRRPEVRYCGTPLRYTFHEADHEKVLTLVDIDAGGSVTVEELPLKPLHDMREVSGYFEDLKEQAASEGAAAQDYVRVTLLDDALMDALVKVREFYPNAMALDFARVKGAEVSQMSRVEAIEAKSLPELFSEYFALQTGEELSESQDELVATLAHEIGEVRA